VPVFWDATTAVGKYILPYAERFAEFSGLKTTASGIDRKSDHHFLNLPVEIRLQIYSELRKSKNVYSRESLGLTALLALQRTCKQTRQETLSTIEPMLEYKRQQLAVRSMLQPPRRADIGGAAGLALAVVLMRLRAALRRFGI
jgi:hypothetical protein